MIFDLSLLKSELRVASLSYRPEIDGLRAVAVVFVILYHAKVMLFGRDFFSGGYAGVDVFFVISGFLISRIILFELATTGKFSFLNFYERRLRRIAPMLLATMATSLLFAWFIIQPFDFIIFSKSLISSLFFFSNIFFFQTTTNYGAADAQLNPLLHTWSLSVEEQFYLILPFFGLMQLYYRRFFVFFLLLLLSSFLFSVYLSSRNSSFNFYSPLSRFWELGVGSVLAVLDLRGFFSKRNAIRSFLPFAGMLFLGFSFFYFDKSTRHPGGITLLPVLGAALIIGFATKDEIVGKLLSSRPLVLVGLVSYSLYLVHFPLFSLFRVSVGEPALWDKALILLVTSVISVPCYFFVEKPFRSGHFIQTRPFLVLLTCSVLAVMGFSGLAVLHDGFPARFKIGWQNFERDSGRLREGFDRFFFENRTLLSTPLTGKHNVYVFGNSHSIDFLSALLLKTDSYDGFHFVKAAHHEQLSCFDERDLRFQRQRSALYESAAYKNSEIFVLAGRFVNAHCNAEMIDNPSDADGLQFLVPRLRKDKKKVVLLGNTAVIGQIDGKWVAEWVYDKAVSDHIDFNSSAEFLDYNRLAARSAFKNQESFNLETNRRLRRFAFENGLIYFSRRQLFCNDEKLECMTISDDGHRLRYDYGHLTLFGKEVLGERLLSVNFKDVLVKALGHNYSSDRFSAYAGSLSDAPR